MASYGTNYGLIMVPYGINYGMASCAINYGPLWEAPVMGPYVIYYVVP